MENKGLANRIAQICFGRPKVSHITLEELGSFIWQQIDGEKSILQIGELVQEAFGEKAEPLYERLAHVFGTFIARSDYEFLGIIHILLGNTGNFVGHCCAEEQHFTLFGNTRKDTVYVVDKPHIEHLVSLVKHHRMNGAEVDRATIYQIEKTTGRSHHNVDTATQGAYLAFDARPAVDGQHFQPLDILREISQVVALSFTMQSGS